LSYDHHVYRVSAAGYIRDQFEAFQLSPDR